MPVVKPTIVAVDAIESLRTVATVGGVKAGAGASIQARGAGTIVWWWYYVKK